MTMTLDCSRVEWRKNQAYISYGFGVIAAKPKLSYTSYDDDDDDVM